MALPRLQGVELNDDPRAPALLRETIIETLSLALRIGGMMEKLVPTLEDALARTGATELLDLCGGAGGPAAILSDAFAARGRRVPIVITDLQPHVGEWEALAARHPGVDFAPEPVDATRIPEGLTRSADGRPRLRVVLNALHHFPPPLARGILEDAHRAGAPIVVCELFDRNPLQFLSFAPAGLAAAALLPLRTRRNRAGKVLLHWLTPVAVLAGGYDGLLSTMRMHTDADLLDMTRDLTDFDWRPAGFAYAPLGRGRTFTGTPRRSAGAT